MRTCFYLIFFMIGILLSCATEKSPLSVVTDETETEIDDQDLTTNAICKTVNGQECVVYYREFNSNNKVVIAPDSIISKAFTHIVDKVGKEYADQYFTLHSANHTDYPRMWDTSDSCYFFYYEYKVTIDDFTTILPIRFTTNLDGDLLSGFRLPERLSDPKFGMPITISDSVAVLLAQNDGLPGSIDPYEISFTILWNKNDEYTYCWYIKSFVWGRTSGQYIRIDATNGELIDKGGFIVATPVG